jgi:heme oxygenase
MEYIFSEVNNTYYTIVDVADDVFKLNKKLHKEITKVDKIWKSRLLNC